MQLGLVAFREIPLRLDRGLAKFLQFLGSRRACRTEALHHQPIDIVAAEVRVAVGREHLKHTVFDAENRDIEGAAAEIVDGDDAGMALVQSIRQRRRRRFVDDPKHLEAGDATGVASSGALGVVEVGRNRNDRAINLTVDLSGGRKVFLRPALQLAQDKRRDLWRREFLVAETDANDPFIVTSDAERKVRRLGLHILAPFAHEPLHGICSTARLGQQPALRFATNEDRAVLRDRHDRWHQCVAALVANDDRHTVLHVPDERIGRPEIDADNFAHTL